MPVLMSFYPKIMALDIGFGARRYPFPAAGGSCDSGDRVPRLPPHKRKTGRRKSLLPVMQHCSRRMLRTDSCRRVIFNHPDRNLLCPCLYSRANRPSVQCSSPVRSIEHIRSARERGDSWFGESPGESCSAGGRGGSGQTACVGRTSSRKQANSAPAIRMTEE